MTKAADIAMTAYEQALAAEEARKAREKAEQEARDRQRHAEHLADFQAALPKLQEWFPGVHWTWEPNDFGTLIHDASESYPYSFTLKVERRMIDMNEPDAGYHVNIYVGNYAPDTSMPGYSYFRGPQIKSAADLGAYLASKAKR